MPIARRLLLMLLLAGMLPARAAEPVRDWRKVGVAEYGKTIYYDAASLLTTDQVLAGRIRADLPEVVVNLKGKMARVDMDVKVHCADFTMVIRRAMIYQDYAGEHLFKDDINGGDQQAFRPYDTASWVSIAVRGMCHGNTSPSASSGQQH